MAWVCEKYGVKKQCLIFIELMTNLPIICFSVDSNHKGTTVGHKKHMKMTHDKKLLEAVINGMFNNVLVLMFMVLIFTLLHIG